MRFEKVKRFKDVDIPMPERKTAKAAGYDFVVAEDIIIPPYQNLKDELINESMRRGEFVEDEPITLLRLGDYSKTTKAKPTLVSTGMKAYLDDGKYLAGLIQTKSNI